MASRPSRKTGSVSTGRMLRPKAVVLPDTALMPEHRLVKPAPNQFTHELSRAQPYFYAIPRDRPDGRFRAGTRVVLMVYDGGQYCRVIDARSLYVETAYSGLRHL